MHKITVCELHAYSVTQLCPTLCDPTESSLLGSVSMGLFRQEYFLLQGIFLTQRLNPGLLSCRQILYYHLNHQGAQFVN